LGGKKSACADTPANAFTTILIVGLRKERLEVRAMPVDEPINHLCWEFGCGSIILRIGEWNVPGPLWDENTRVESYYAEDGSKRQITTKALLPGETEWSAIPDATGKETMNWPRHEVGWGVHVTVQKSRGKYPSRKQSVLDDLWYSDADLTLETSWDMFRWDPNE
jgi:hypothetical protein